MNFTPCADPLDWDLDTHGIRISFTHHSRRYSATYLPDVAVEQGWNKEETIVSLMRKAGWSGRSKDWTKVFDLKCIRYEGKKASLDYQAWKEWRDWVNADVKTR
jgi:AMMECR1 domain-containing protein